METTLQSEDPLVWYLREFAPYTISTDQSFLNKQAQWAVAPGPPTPTGLRGPQIEGKKKFSFYLFFPFFFRLLTKVGYWGPRQTVLPGSCEAVRTVLLQKA